MNDVISNSSKLGRYIEYTTAIGARMWVVTRFHGDLLAAWENARMMLLIPSQYMHHYVVLLCDQV